MSEFGGGGFLGAIGGILTGIVGFLRGFLSITTAQLLRLVQYLRDQLVAMSKQMLAAVWRAGRALAKALLTLGRLAGAGLKSFVLWAGRKLAALEHWLKELFAPVLRFLKQVKDHIDEFYKKFVRPIIDTIEFLRQINRVLQVFHINLLRKLDLTLAKIEQRIEDPFLWVRSHITEVENWINRIVTLDGLFQRLTLLRSMSRYAPLWMRIAVGARSTPVTPGDYDRIYRAFGGHSIEVIEQAVNDSISGRDGLYTTFVDEFAAQWRMYIESA